MDKRVIFCCDANTKSGLGHFSRSLNLAKGLVRKNQELRVLFIGDYSEFAKEILIKSNIDHLEQPDLFTNPRSLESYLNNETSFFLDSYEINQSWLNGICEMTNRVLMFDDFNELDYSGVLLVVNFRACSSLFDYNAKNSLCGLPYTPLKVELEAVRDHKNKNISQENNCIMIFISGTDRHNVGIKILSLLDSHLEGKQLIYIGKDKYAAAPSGKNEIVSKENVADIEVIYTKSDVAITGGGFSRYEAAYCGIPSLTVSQTNEQGDDIVIFSEENLTVNAGFAETFNEKRFLKLYDELLQGEEPGRMQSACFRAFNESPMSNLTNAVLETLEKN